MIHLCEQENPSQMLTLSLLLPFSNISYSLSTGLNPPTHLFCLRFLAVGSCTSAAITGYCDFLLPAAISVSLLSPSRAILTIPQDLSCLSLTISSFPAACWRWTRILFFFYLRSLKRQLISPTLQIPNNQPFYPSFSTQSCPSFLRRYRISSLITIKKVGEIPLLSQSPS